MRSICSLLNYCLRASARELRRAVRNHQRVCAPTRTIHIALLTIFPVADCNSYYCAHQLESFGVPYEITIVSAHRTPQRMFDYAKSAPDRGIKVSLSPYSCSSFLFFSFFSSPLCQVGARLRHRGLSLLLSPSPSSPSSPSQIFYVLEI